MSYRSRAFLNLAHKLTTCTNCEAYTPGCEPAHQNSATVKGFGCKAPDNRHAALCHACHFWLDQGGRGKDPSGRYSATKLDKADLWLRAHLVTMDTYFANGWLKVAA